MNGLNLCKDHKQEWKQSEYDSHNCDYCKLLKQLAAAQERIKELTQSDPCWYDMSEADAFRLWKEDRERMGRYQTALKEIANPLGAIIAEADSKGYFVNGAMTLAIANDPEHLKSIAQAALKE